MNPFIAIALNKNKKTAINSGPRLSQALLITDRC